MYQAPTEHETLIQAFEAGDVPADATFSHREHVLVTWHLFHRYAATRVIEVLRDGLKAVAASRGKPERYHETITWAFATMIHERLARMDSDATWEEFAARNEDLFEWETSIARFYSREALDSDLARRVFVLPDRCVGWGDRGDG